MKKSWVTVLFLVLLFQCLGQGIEIKGVVYSNHYPVENANIQVLKKEQKSATDSDGVFHLFTNQLPVTLRFTHLAYQTLDVKITEKHLKGATDSVIFINIELQSNIQNLPEVSISGSKVQKAYNKPKTSIIDYDIVGDNLYLILQDKNQYLRMTNFNSKTIDEIQIKTDLKTLYKDYLGNLHILLQDSAYQIFYYNDSLLFAYPTERKFFEQLLYPIVANTECCMYFQYYSMHNQYLFYIKIDKDTKNRSLLTAIFDKEQAITNQRKYEEFARHSAAGHISQESDHDASTEVIPSGRAAFDAYSFYKHVLSKPLYSPLVLVKDSLYVFDHLNGFLYQYDLDGNLQNKKTISYQKERGWAKEIIVDAEQTRCFAKFITNGIATLKEIDLGTGKIKASYVLEHHIFPEKIRIKDGYAFYLYKNLKSEDIQSRYLWKQKLE